MSEEQERAEITARVGAIWRKALERPDLDQHADFYLHGSHFLAPEMIDSINAEFGLTLTVLDLEQGRTIARMTDLIYFERKRIDQSTVVPLRNMGASRPPLFIVHGVGGNVLGFYALAKCLDCDQPVYGIQAQGLLPGREAKLRLEEMAAEYVQDMRAVCPAGPYHLLGFSFGGLVAYEIARQLHAAGLEVGMVGMLDTRQPEWMRGVPAPGGWPRRVLLRLRQVYLHTHKRKGRIQYLWRRVGERALRFRYMYAASTGQRQVATTVRNVREINLVAGIGYKVRPYAGRVTLFRAETSPDERALPEDLLWGRFARGGVDITHLPGDHGRILYEPGLSAMAAELERQLGAEPAYARSEAAQGRVEMEF
jgi:thioesterase domain-containing protein